MRLSPMPSRRLSIVVASSVALGAIAGVSGYELFVICAVMTAGLAHEGMVAGPAAATDASPPTAVARRGVAP